MTARTVSTGQLHLHVHTLLGSHRESTSKRVKDRARQQLLIDLPRARKHADSTALLCRCTTGEPPRHKGFLILEHSNPHGVALGDLERLQAALATTYAPIRPGPGLLLQTLNPRLRVLAGVGLNGGTAAGKPASRPPSGTGLDGLVLIRDIQDQLHDHLGKLHAELGTTHRLLPWQKALWSLPVLAEHLQPGPDRDATVHGLEKDLSRWINRSRVLLRHVAPMITLNGKCPHCNEQSMIVRDDASTDVICTTDGCEDENGDQSRWGQKHWEALLEGRYASGLVNTEAAALHLGVTAATIRDWKRRGLIRPALKTDGTPLGTSRQPFWRLSELIEASGAPKPRRAEETMEATA